MQTKHQHTGSGDFQTLPAGLADRNTEMFFDGRFLKGTHKGQTLHFENLPAKIKLYFGTLLSKAISQNKNLEKTLADTFGCKTYEQDLEQFIICNYGGYDTNPDFNNLSEPIKEYWNCGQRGICEAEGIVCKPRCISETNLSIREIEVIKHIAKGLIAKEIADTLDIETSTVHTHERNIHSKLNLNNRGEIIRFAFKNNIAI